MVSGFFWSCNISRILLLSLRTFLIPVCRFYSGMCLLAILLLTTVVKMHLGFF